MMGSEGLVASISARRVATTLGLVMRCRKVPRMAVAVVSEPARLNETLVSISYALVLSGRHGLTSA